MLDERRDPLGRIPLEIYMNVITDHVLVEAADDRIRLKQWHINFNRTSPQEASSTEDYTCRIYFV